MRRWTAVVLILIAAFGPLLLGLWLTFWIQPAELGDSWAQAYLRLQGKGLASVLVYAIIWTVFVAVAALVLVITVVRSAHPSSLRSVALVTISFGLSAPGVLLPSLTMDHVIARLDPDAAGGFGPLLGALTFVGVAALVAGSWLFAESRPRRAPSGLVEPARTYR